MINHIAPVVLENDGPKDGGCAKANSDLGATAKLKDLCCKAVPAHGSALDDVWRRNLYDRGSGIGYDLGVPIRAGRTVP